MSDPIPLYTEHLKQIVSDAQKILEDQDFDSLVLFSGAETFYHADDVEIPFRPAAHLARFVPVRRANRCVVISKNTSTPTLIAHTPKDYWLDHSEQGDEFWKDYFDIVEAETLEKWQKEIEVRADKVSAYIGPKYTKLKNGSWNPKSVVEVLDEGRGVKTPYEIACLEAANIKAVPGHRRVKEAFLSGASEKELHWEYLKALNATEQDMLYPPIIAFNEKASVLHYEHRKDEKNGMSCLIDAGMSYLGYGSDISRTYAKEEAHPVFLSLIKAIDELQQKLASSVSVGTDVIELNHQTQLGIGTILREHDVIDISPEEAVSKKVTFHFLPHSVEHSLGLQTHDVGRGSSTAMKENYVTTVEPGIYFNSLLMDALKKKEEGSTVNWTLVDELIPFGGIRIEDNVQVTKSSPRNLTRAAFDTQLG